MKSTDQEKQQASKGRSNADHQTGNGLAKPAISVLQPKNQGPEADRQQGMADMRAASAVMKKENPAIVSDEAAPTQLQKVDMQATRETPPVQMKKIEKQTAYITELTTAMGQIADEDNQGSKADFTVHDKALRSGQHHGVRNVTKKRLRQDLQDKIDEITGLKSAAEKALEGLKGAKKTAQLKSPGQWLNND